MLAPLKPSKICQLLTAAQPRDKWIIGQGWAEERQPSLGQITSDLLCSRYTSRQFAGEKSS